MHTSVCRECDESRAPISPHLFVHPQIKAAKKCVYIYLLFLFAYKCVCSNSIRLGNDRCLLILSLVYPFIRWHVVVTLIAQTNVIYYRHRVRVVCIVIISRC